MGKQAVENEVRSRVFGVICPILEQAFGTDILDISVSEITLPILDAEGNEIFANIKVTVPRGKQNGEGSYIPYDGYKEHEDWVLTKEARSAKKAASEEKRRKKEEEAQRKRDAKKSIKTMKKEINEVLPNQTGA